MMRRPAFRVPGPGLRALLALTLGLPFAAAPAAAQQARTLSLDEAFQLAADGNDGLEAMRLRVEEMERRSAVSFTNYLPRIETMGGYLVNNNTQGILIPQGSLGTFPGLGTFPPADTNIPQGGTDLFFTLTTIAQPLTHFFKIREGRGVVDADEAIARAALKRTEQDVTIGVLQGYAGLLLARQSLEVARLQVAAAEQRIGYQQVAVSSGSAHEVAEREARVRWLQARQALLEQENQVDELEYRLGDALGLAVGTRLELAAPELPEVTLGTVDDYVETALRENPDVLEARATVQKATHGLGAARADYIPEIGLIGAHIYQSSVPFFPKHTFGFGIQGKWTILDFGARRNTVGERRSQLGQAEHNLEMVEGRVRGEVEAAYRRVQRARDMVEIAREAMALQSEGARLRILQANTGYAVPAQEQEAAADRLQAELDALKAEFGYHLAVAELLQTVGILGVRVAGG
jgi:outer membrane protein TolC